MNTETKRVFRPELLHFLLLLVGATVGCLACELFCSLVLHLKGVYTSPFLASPAADYAMWVEKFRQAHTDRFFTTGGEPYLYPAGAAVIQWPFSNFHHHGLIWFTLCSAAIALFAGYLFIRTLRRSGCTATHSFLFVGSLMLFSFPLWFTLQRANIEFFIFGLVAAGIWCFFHDRPVPAAICFGVAGGMKYYPLIFLALYLTKKQWKPIAGAVLVAVLTTLTGLWIIHPDLRRAWAYNKLGMERADLLVFFQQNPLQGGFDHSLLGIYKRLTIDYPSLEQMKVAVHWYIIILGVVGLLIYGLRLRKLPVENELLGLTAAVLIFMPMSYDYTLLHLYTPFVVLVLYLVRRPNVPLTPRLKLVFSLLALTMVPLSEFIYHGTTFSGVIKALAILGLLAVSATRPIFDDLAQETVPVGSQLAATAPL